MSPPAVTASRSVRLRPARDGRLLPYILIALGGLAGSLVVGQPAGAALAMPFLVAIGLGLRRTGPVWVKARVVLDTDRVLEGDVVTGRLELEWDGVFDARVILHRLQGLAPSSPEDSHLGLRGASSVDLPIRLQAARWGRHSIGEVWLRLTTPFGLLSWTGKIMAGPPVSVLPGRERLERLLDPPESRAVWGLHRSRRLGDGHEFAELRPYQPGDRLRDLNWAATARRRSPYVNRHHPELAGDVVIALDAFEDGSTHSVEALAKAARVGWALVSVHLRANDRVGLLGIGGSTQWLSPASGRLARYRLLETLLRVGGEAADRVALGRRRRPAVPSAALIIVLTPLHERRTLETLESWRARGRSVAAVVMDTSELLGEPASEAEALAWRLWRLEIDRRMQELVRLGVPVVSAPVEGAITPVINALRRARQVPSMKGGRS